MIQTMQIGEEDGAPVCVAIARCVLEILSYALGSEPPEVPPETILWWDVENDTDTIEDGTVMVRVIAVPVGSDPAPASERWPLGWRWHDPQMGAVAHDITWSTGHTSSSATVCDLYLDDASVLLTVVTPAHQQAVNMAQVGTAAYTVPGEA